MSIVVRQSDVSSVVVSLLSRVRAKVRELWMTAQRLWMTLAQATQRGGRSNALNPLGWMVAVVGGVLIGALSRKAPVWLMVGVSVAGGFVVAAYLVAYFYFMVKQPDALRSEHYSLYKMQLERTQMGDTQRGFALIAPTEPANASQALLPAPPDEENSQ